MTQVSNGEINQFEVIVKNADLPVAKAEYILGQFKEFFDIAARWEKKAMSIVVTDESQTDAMKEARTARLILKGKRVKIDNTRKALKAHLISEGKAIQGMANILIGIISPLEKHLQEQEDFVKIKKAKEEAERAEKARILLEEKEAEERAKAEQAEKERQEKLRKDNERLQKQLETERAERAKDAKIQREKEIKAQNEAREKVFNEKMKRIAAEEKAEKEKTQLKEKVEKLAVGEVQCPKCKHIFKS